LEKILQKRVTVLAGNTLRVKLNTVDRMSFVHDPLNTPSSLVAVTSNEAGTLSGTMVKE